MFKFHTKSHPLGRKQMFPVLIHLTLFGGRGASDRVEACVAGTLKLSPFETRQVLLDLEDITLPINFELIREVIGLSHVTIHAQFIMCGAGSILGPREAAAGLNWIIRAFKKGNFHRCTLDGEPMPED